jgi:hypothetical protein
MLFAQKWKIFYLMRARKLKIFLLSFPIKPDTTAAGGEQLHNLGI